MSAVPNTVPQANNNAYNPPRVPEVYTLPDNINTAIPPELRHRYHCDNQGRILFFTAPPLKRPESGVAPEYAGLGHSVRFLNGLQAFREERQRKRKERDEKVANEARKREARDAADKEQSTRDLSDAAGNALGEFVEMIDKGNKLLYESLGGWDRKALEEEEELVAAQAKTTQPTTTKKNGLVAVASHGTTRAH